MQLPWEMDDHHLWDDLFTLATKSVEGPYSHSRVQVGSVTLSCTGNTPTGKTVTFAKPYKSGTTPTLLLFVNPTTTSSKVTPSYANLTNTGAQMQAYSDTTQNVTVNYIAIGQTGGA